MTDAAMPLTPEEEAALRRGEFPTLVTMERLFATLDATRAQLAGMVGERDAEREISRGWEELWPAAAKERDGERCKYCDEAERKRDSVRAQYNVVEAELAALRALADAVEREQRDGVVRCLQAQLSDVRVAQRKP